MKKIIVTLLLMAGIISCNTVDSKIKYSYSVNDEGMVRREMAAKNTLTDTEIEMEGNASFSADGTTITGITPGGFINFRDKKKELKIINTEGSIATHINISDRKISLTSDTGKEIMADAARQVKKLQARQK
jgi:hypothetical protein